MTEEKSHEHARILKRVRTLLDLAGQPGNTAVEAERAREKANELIEKYHIDQAMLEENTVSAEGVLVRELRIRAPYAKEKGSLLAVLAAHFGVEACLLPDRTRTGQISYAKGTTVEVVGFESDLDLMEMLFDSLLLQIDIDLPRARSFNPKEDLATFRASFLYGFATKIKERLAAIRRQTTQQAEESGSGKALERVLDARHSLVTALFKQRHPKIKKTKAQSSGSGFDRGSYAAERADLGQTKLANVPR